MPNRLVNVQNLKKYFPVERGLLSFHTGKEFVHAVDDVSFTIQKGETFSLVGETGSGKTTTGRCVIRLIEPSSGKIEFDGVDVLSLDKNGLREARRNMQMIFQDPYASLNPRMTVGESIELPLKVHKIAYAGERRRIVLDLLDKVGLSPANQYVDRNPHEFSGGQRQRIGIARALACKPKLIVEDEPVSALDVSVRGQILNLLQDLKRDFGLTYLLIAHDLSVVRYMSDVVGVMYLAKIMELGPSEEIFENPLHPYTRKLLAAVPLISSTLRRERIKLRGEPPSPISPPSGCRFHTRCPWAKKRCEMEEPVLVADGSTHYVACHFADEIKQEC
jgi:oligopeptide/dipeptide ABC transporter ATP-binding protein